VSSAPFLCDRRWLFFLLSSFSSLPPLLFRVETLTDFRVEVGRGGGCGEGGKEKNTHT